MINITIEQIKYFLAIKKFKGFSIAAEELCISQSSLSKQIKSLESELNTILFDRASRVTKLTTAGEDFYKYAEKFLEDYNNIIQGMKKHSLSKKSHLRLGTIAVLSQYGLTSTIASFKKKYPNININIFEDENDAILNMLVKSEIDFAIVRDFNLSSNSFDITPLSKDELVVVTSNNHPFTKKKYISFADLKDENFIIGAKSSVYDICVKECTKLGFTPNIIHNISKIETILGLVSEGLGITLIVNNVLKPFSNPNISIHPLKTPINFNLALIANLKSLDSEKYKDFYAFKDFIINTTK